MSQFRVKSSDYNGIKPKIGASACPSVDCASHCVGTVPCRAEAGRRHISNLIGDIILAAPGHGFCALATSGSIPVRKPMLSGLIVL